jgi:threonine/homoserine/homoserine lactone efflux protein
LTGNLITISVIGLIAGFIFSMPVAGPISILVTSNALKGRLSYCNLLALGASIADLMYILVAVYGITHFITEYKGLIPYILGAGSLFIIYVGIRIILTKFDIEHIDEESSHVNTGSKKQKGAFYTGFMVNIFNPTLFFGWLVSSFIALSFAASLGFNTSGLNTAVDQSLGQIEKIDGNLAEKPQMPSYLQFDTLKILKNENHIVKPKKLPVNYHLLASIFYSVFLSAGSVLWYLVLAALIVRFRKKIKINIVNWLVRSLGIILCLIGISFGYSAIKLLL